MQKATHYKNGQVISKMKGSVKTVFYKNGKIRAKGKSVNGHMEGKWVFYRETGQLWGIGSLKHDLKHGTWIRYDRKDKEEYRGDFVEGKIVKPSPFPKIGAPAERAFASAGIKKLSDLTKWTEKDLLSLHGMGPKALGILKSALKSGGKSLKPQK